MINNPNNIRPTLQEFQSYAGTVPPNSKRVIFSTGNPNTPFVRERKPANLTEEEKKNNQNVKNAFIQAVSKVYDPGQSIVVANKFTDDNQPFQVCHLSKALVYLNQPECNENKLITYIDLGHAFPQNKVDTSMLDRCIADTKPRGYAISSDERTEIRDKVLKELDSLATPLSISSMRTVTEHVVERHFAPKLEMQKIASAKFQDVFNRRFPIGNNRKSDSLLDLTIRHYKPSGHDVEIEEYRKIRNAIVSEVNARIDKDEQFSRDDLKEIAVRLTKKHFEIHPNLSYPGLRLSMSGISPLHQNDIVGEQDEWNALQAQYAIMSPPKQPSDYFNKIHIKLDDSHQDCKEWAINYHMLQHLANDNHLPIETKRILDQRSLGYLYNFSSIENMKYMGWANSPINPSGGFYSRVATTPLRTEFVKKLLINSKIAVDISDNSRPGYAVISSPNDFEAVKRQFGGNDSESTAILKTTDDVGGIAKQIIAQLGSHDGRVLIDINELIRTKIPNPKGLTADALRAKITEVFIDVQTKIFEYCVATVRDMKDRLPLTDVAAEVSSMMDWFAKRAIVGGTAQIGQTTFLLFDTLDLRTGIPAENISALKGKIGTAAYHSGSTVMPQQIFDGISKFSTPQDFLQDFQIPNGGNVKDEVIDKPIYLPKPKNIGTFNTLDDFLGHKPIRDFGKIVMKARKLGKEVPSVAVLGQLILDQLNGLNSVKLKQKIDNYFVDAKAPILQYLYNRILSHLENATKHCHSGEEGAFINDIHLCQEEITTLLALTQPYDLEDLNLNMPESALIKPRYTLTNSGMSAFSGILSGVEAQKGDGSLNVVMQKGCYYEQTLEVLPGAAKYKSNTLDGRRYKSSTKGIAASLAEQSTTSRKDEKLDIFVGEFHHNITVDADSYQAENVKKQVRRLINDKLVSNHFTVALDITIARTDAPEITDFLEEFKNEIADGSLNVVLFRSGQKFDMGGMDHLNGGLVATYNDGNNYGAYNDAATDKHYLPSPSTVQGMIHLQTTAGNALNNYRDAIMASHNKLLSNGNDASFPRYMLDSAESPMLQIAANNDENVVFLDIRAPKYQDNPQRRAQINKYNKLMFANLAKKHELCLDGRPSFGFPHVNIVDIGDEKLRLTVGLENENDLKTIRNLLIAISDISKNIIDATDGLGHYGILMSKRDKNDIVFPSSAGADLIDLVATIKTIDPEFRVNFVRNGQNLDVEIAGDTFNDLSKKEKKKWLKQLANAWGEAEQPTLAQAIRTKMGSI